MAAAPEVVVDLIDRAANMASVGVGGDQRKYLDRFRAIYRHLYATVQGADGALIHPQKGWDELSDEGMDAFK